MCLKPTVLVNIIMGLTIMISANASGGVVAQINEYTYAMVGEDEYSIATIANNQVVDTREFDNRIINVKWSNAATCLIVDTENLQNETIECQILDKDLRTINTLVAKEQVSVLSNDQQYLYFTGISQSLDYNVYRLSSGEVAWSFEAFVDDCPFFNFANIGNQQWICVKHTFGQDEILLIQMPNNLIIWKSKFDNLGSTYYFPISGVASTGQYIYLTASVDIYHFPLLYILNRPTGNLIQIIKLACSRGGGMLCRAHVKFKILRRIL